MNDWGQRDRQPYQERPNGNAFDLWIAEQGQRLGHTGETNVEIKVDLLKATKEMLEGVVTRGHVENEAEQILVSTAALLWDFLFSQGVDSELSILHERQKEMGLFFPPLVEAIFDWMIDGRDSIIEEIKVLARGG